MTNEELCIACQAGETNAAEELIAANFPFIRSVALGFERLFPGMWLDADDVIEYSEIEKINQLKSQGQVCYKERL